LFTFGKEKMPDMKKLDFPIIIIITLLAFVCYFVCIASTNPPQKQHRACGVSPKRLSYGVMQPATEAVFNPPYKWAGRKILYVFFTDTYDYQLMQKTLGVANTWGNYAKLNFVLTADIFQSDIRVSYREPNGYLSYIGNEAASLGLGGKATLWLQDLDKEDDAEFTRVVLHEFGHAIGLEHELQSVNANIKWDTTAVYKYYDTAYGWSSQKVNDNIFTTINTAEATRFDPKSIMIYAVPAFLTKDKIAIPWPDGLSDTDKKTIQKYYR